MRYVTLTVLIMLLVGCNQNTALPTLAKLPTIAPSLTATATASPTSSPTATKTATPTSSPTATLTAKRETEPILSNQDGQTYITYSCPHEPPNPKIYLFDEAYDDWDDYITVVANTICDVHYFWQMELGNRYTPPNYVVHNKFSDTGQALSPKDFRTCAINPEIEFRGRYCNKIDNPGILVDSLSTFENYQDYGAFDVIQVIAHEWGHHIQFIVWKDYNFSELQADCLVGAYARYAMNNLDSIQIPVIFAEWEAYVHSYETSNNDLVASEAYYGGWDNITNGHVADAMTLGFEDGVSACINTDFSINGDA